MATPTTWRKVAVKMQSAIAAAVTITAITKANPGVATSTAHGFSDGDILVLKSSSMRQIDMKVVRVANKADNTFELEGVDTTLFDDFVSGGTAEKVTLATTISSMTNITASGGDFGFIDTTTIHDGFRQQIPDIPNAISYSTDNMWDPTDAGQIALKAANDTQAQRVILMQFPSGWKVYIYGFVGYVGLPGGQAGGLVSTPAVFTVNGLPTYYAS